MNKHFDFGFSPKHRSLYCHSNEMKKTTHSNFSDIVGLSVEGCFFCALVIHVARKFLKQRRSWVLLLLLWASVSSVFNSLLQIVLSPQFAFLGEGVAKNLLNYAVPHAVNLLYLVVVLERLKHFSYFIPHWRPIRIGWWSLLLLSEAVLILFLCLNRSILPDVLFYQAILNLWCLLCCISCNTHVDLLLVKCLAKRKVATEAAKITRTTKSLQLCVAGSLVACIIGPFVFTFWAISWRQEWFPIWLMYVCGVLSYSPKAIHFAFQIRFQTLVSDMMVNEETQVVVRPTQATVLCESNAQLSLCQERGARP
jgi:hypothetical protein